MTTYTPITQSIVPEGIVLQTCIIENDGIRMEQPLIKEGNLWWTADRKMYIYYTPTHWKQ